MLFIVINYGETYEGAEQPPVVVRGPFSRKAQLISRRNRNEVCVVQTRLNKENVHIMPGNCQSDANFFFVIFISEFSFLNFFFCK